MFNNWLFLNTPLELAGLLFIVLFAGVVRGAIGFGFSALVVASSMFWLPPVAVICLVILLEAAASLLMFRQTKTAINKPVLWRLSLSGAISCVIGVTLLSILPQQWLSLFITIYLATISLLTLSRCTFKNTVAIKHYSLVGFFAGLVNGLAGMGGLFVAFYMTATKTNVGQLRATISAYFLFSEIIFIATAIFQGLYTLKILATAMICLIPLSIGLKLGNHCFNYFSEEQLKRGVLIALVALSSFGLIKTLSTLAY